VSRRRFGLGDFLQQTGIVDLFWFATAENSGNNSNGTEAQRRQKQPWSVRNSERGSGGKSKLPFA
jgi:hypothetical protein